MVTSHRWTWRTEWGRIRLGCALFLLVCAAVAYFGTPVGLQAFKYYQLADEMKTQVIETIKAGNFHIWPIENIDEGLSLLTDMEIGTLQEDGTYPTGTFNQAVDTQLLKFREVLKPQEERSET